MGVMMEGYGRQDIAFARGTTFWFGARWTQSADGGRTFKPVDLTAYDCHALFYDMADRLLYDRQADETTSDGVAKVCIPAELTGSDTWVGRRQGTWRIVASQSSGEALSVSWAGESDVSESLLESVPDLDSGEVKLIAWGYWRCD